MPLSFVPTPIGNLDDITIRSLNVLKNAEIVFCEDTRVAKKLLSLLSEKHNIEFNITNFISLHSHNEEYKITNLDIGLFIKNCVYMSDAGMPCISDPGAKLVDFCIQNRIEYDVLTGANSVLTAYAASGFLQNEFSFFGFLPHKTVAKKEALVKLLNKQESVIILESPHRLLDTLEILSILEPQRNLFLAKELTKLHQKYFKENAITLYENLKKQKILGEWVIVIESNKDYELVDDSLFKPNMDKKSLSKAISKITGQDAKSIYSALTANLR